MRIIVDAFAHPVLNRRNPLFSQRIRGAGFVLIRLSLAAKGNEQIPIKDAGNRLAQQRQGQRQAAVLLKAGEIERCNGDIPVTSLDQCLAQQFDVIGGTASAARLGDKQRRVVKVILAGIERINKLADDEQRRVAGIIVDVFQPKLCHLAAAVAKDLNVIALTFQCGLNEPELGDSHIGD